MRIFKCSWQGQSLGRDDVLKVPGFPNTDAGRAPKGKRLRLIAKVLIAIAFAGIGAGSAQAADEFTFRRIGLPQAGAGRITVQIALGASTTPEAGSGDEMAPEPTPSGYEWFWAQVPSQISAETSGAARFSRAIEVLEAAAPSVGGPRLSHLQKIAEQHGAIILRETVGTRVSPALVLALIATESAGQADAISPAGASGLMQLMPETAARFGVEDRSDPAQSIRGGVAYLNWLVQEFGGDVVMALAGYNAGEGAVRRNLGVPPYAETRGYVPKVLAAWRVARGLCLTPPELPSDGCVFALRKASAQ